jgi:hypothetical protein
MSPRGGPDADRRLVLLCSLLLVRSECCCILDKVLGNESLAGSREAMREVLLFEWRYFVGDNERVNDLEKPDGEVGRTRRNKDNLVLRVPDTSDNESSETRGLLVCSVSDISKEEGRGNFQSTNSSTIL